MAKSDYIVIQLPEWDGWRIAGSDNDWQMQVYEEHGNKDGSPRWRGTNFWPSIEFAVSYAYERTLRESGKHIKSMDGLLDECARVKDELIAAVRKADE